MPWAAAAIGAVGSVAASAIGSGKGSGGGKTSQSQSTPWDIQQQQQGLANQQGLYNFRMANGPYQGSFYSPINSTQTGAAQQATNWTGSQGQADANAMWNTAQQLQAGAPQYQQNAFNAAQNGLIGGPNAGMMGTLQGYGNGSQTTQGANPTLGQSLELAGTWGAQALAGFQGNLQDAGNRAGQDATNQVSQDASAYATNPFVQSAINNANNQIDTTLNESTVPGLNRAASQGGDLNSSRAGMAEAEANRGAALAKGNADSSIVNNAYNQGLGTASNLYSSGLNSQINAGSLGYNDMGNLSNTVANQQQQLHEFNTNTQLNAAQAGLASDLNYRNANAQTQLAGNQQLGTSVGQGIGAGMDAQQVAAANFALGQGAGSLYQNDQNAQLQNAYQQWQATNGSYQQGLLNDANNTAATFGGQGGIQTGSQQTQLPPNYAGNALGGAIGGYALGNPGNGQQGLFGGVGDWLSNQWSGLRGNGTAGPTGSGLMSGGLGLYG